MSGQYFEFCEFKKQHTRLYLVELHADAVVESGCVNFENGAPTEALVLDYGACAEFRCAVQGVVGSCGCGSPRGGLWCCCRLWLRTSGAD